MTDLFSKTSSAPETIDPNTDHFAELVGEGKKYRDEKALAYAARKKDEHIRNLEMEQEELRKELQKRLTLEDFVDKMKTSSTQQLQPRTPSNADNNPSERVDNSIKPEDIAKLVDEKLQARLRNIEENENLDKVKKELMKHWGNDYQAKLKIAAQQLEVSEAFIDNLGKTHPDALLRLLEIRESKGSEYSAPPRGGAAPSPANPNNLGERDWKYFEKIRRENPSTYFSRKIQNEIHRLAMEGKLEIPR